MSIAHELSSDVAAAVLTPKSDGSRRDASALAEVVMEVHSTLRRLTAEGRRKARNASDAHHPAFRTQVSARR
ncbi:MAG TPA: hypothetical protein VER32_09985 [Pyrinomonadaceae bacterium]|nr:hypothetical protein [Pyrinomonadaceae bacterium]